MGKHIMISYQWDVQPFAKQLHKALEDSEYQTWLDVEGGMQNNIYKSMGSGITNAGLIVVILTDKYQDSINCAREFTRALEVGKDVPMIVVKQNTCTPKDEFQFGIAGHLYHQFTLTDEKITFDMDAFLNMVNHVLPVDSSVRKNQRKRILVIGATGSGKSTVASMLINGSVRHGFNENGIYVAPGLTYGTFNTTVASNDQYVVTDTVGFSSVTDTQQAHNPFATPEAVQELKNFLIHSRSGYHLIIFVARLGRLSQDQYGVFKLVYNGLFADLKAHFVLVVSYTNFELSNAEAALFAAEYHNLPACFVDFVVADGSDVDDKVVLEVLQEHNAEFLHKLKNFIKEKVPKDKKMVIPKCASLERKAWYAFIKWILEFLGLPMFDDQVKIALVAAGMNEVWVNSIDTYL